MMDSSLPIACTLSDADFRQRREELLKTVAAAVVKKRELTDGVAYCFSSEAEWITELAQLITVERECCSFIAFNLRIELGSGPIWLELTGPEGTKEFLTTLFG